MPTLFFLIIFLIFTSAQASDPFEKYESYLKGITSPVGNVEAIPVKETVTPEQFEKFKELKALQNTNISIPKLEKAHLYKVTKGEWDMFVLGVEHNLPLDMLPQTAVDVIQSAEEFYSESTSLPTIRKLSSFEQSNYPPLKDFISEDTLEKIKNLPCIDYFATFNPSFSLLNMALEQLFIVSCIYGELFSMDQEIELYAFKANKEYVMIDSPRPSEVDEIFKLCLYRQILESIELFRSRGIETSEKIESEATLEFFLEENFKMKPFTTQDIIDHANVDTFSPFEDDPEGEELFSANTRNQRWFEILVKTNPLKKKLCFVGLGHLYGLFNLFRESGYTVDPV